MPLDDAETAQLKAEVSTLSEAYHRLGLARNSLRTYISELLETHRDALTKLADDSILKASPFKLQAAQEQLEAAEKRADIAEAKLSTTEAQRDSAQAENEALKKQIEALLAAQSNR